MSKYEWICLNNTKYDWICHHIPEKNSAECARILNVSDAVHNIRWLYRLQCSYQDRDLFRTLTSIQDVAVCKKKMPECSCTTRIDSGQGWGKFVELWHFDKDLVKYTRKRSHTESFFS